MKILNKTVIAMAILTTSTLSFAVNDIGGVSDGNNINYASKYVSVGPTNTGKVNWDGKAGINIIYKNAPEGKTANNKYQSFAKMASMIDNRFKAFFLKPVLEKTNDGVYIGKMYNMSKIFSYIPGMPEHRDLGAMSFKQVGDMDVWFGDWVDVPRNSKNIDKEASKYTVYYSGTGQTATADLPSGEVHYSITGINKHRHTDTPILKGELNVDFKNNIIDGSIIRNKDQENEFSITFDNGNINKEKASFTADATANTRYDEDYGVAEGKFYGAQAAGVAGMATFEDNHSYDTSFGGMKK